MKAFMRIHIIAFMFIPLFAGCFTKENVTMESTQLVSSGNDTATFGMGCFWCTEAVFQQLKGVNSVTSGYSGGERPNPTYREVCTGLSGHAEVSQIIFDSTQISYEELLEVFWTAHDPTTLNKQGADEGTQYRSVIFFHSSEQQLLAEEYKRRLNEEKAFPKPVITEITAFKAFYKAEDYHMDYYNQNGNAPYCQFVIAPKVDKVRKIFKEKLKK